MPTSAVRLKPGVDTTQTPALNETGIAASQMIRFREGLVEKRGGWTKYYGFPIPGMPRALWPWQDLENAAHVAVGTTTSLSVITNGAALDVSPQSFTTNPALNFSTTSGSATVKVVDAGNSCTAFDIVNLVVPVSVGGVLLSGLYTVAPIDANSYNITSAANATATVSAGGAVPTFQTTTGQFGVAVHLASHGFAIGATFVVAVPVTLGGITLSGFYTVASVAGANDFTINAASKASANAGPTAINSGLARLTYWVAKLPLSPPLGFGQGGFGVGQFGSGASGVARASTAITATDWSLANFGEVLVSCPANGPIFTWTPASGFSSSIIDSSAPSANASILVVKQAQMIVALGSSILGQQDPLLIRWCDAGNYNQWTSSNTNQAGQFRLSTGSRIVGAVSMGLQVLIWTDVSLWSMSYIGGQLVWSFKEIATGCGLIGPHALAQLGDTVFWMSAKKFWMYQGGAQLMPSPIEDTVFGALDRGNVAKICGAPNSAVGEVAWFYPVAGGSGENSAYVSFSPSQNAWDYGTLGRSAWADQSVVGFPIGAASSGYVYQHETSPDADGSPIAASFTTGYFMLSEGDAFCFVDMLHPDVKWLSPGTLNVTVLVSDEASDTPIAYGPYPIAASTRYIPLNLRGRMIALRFASTDLGSAWRLGNMRFRFQPNGKR